MKYTKRLSNKSIDYRKPESETSFSKRPLLRDFEVSDSGLR
jgi:hypothetical protein